jgi:hypothetical protein
LTARTTVAVFAARSSGRSILAIARQFGLSEVAVRSTVAEMVARTYDGERLREDIALENHRLRSISLKYYGLAMDGDGDHQAAAIYVKTSERRMVMLGANAPQQYAVHLMNQAPPRTPARALRRCSTKFAP